MDVPNLYTPLRDALALIDQVPVPSIRIPHGFPSGRCAVITRQVASATHELARFMQLAAENGLIPLSFEFHADKFVAHNTSKLPLAKMRFTDSPGSVSRAPTLTVCDLNAAQGVPLRHLRTRWGESLIDFQHRLLRDMGPVSRDAHYIDGSAWYLSFGAGPADYYQEFFELFLSRCILFETYYSTEAEFTRRVVVPAFNAVTAKHGRKPVIVKLEPDSEEDPYWASYPLALRGAVAEHLNNPERSGEMKHAPKHTRD